ncbi:hypothetical protein [Amycolatopsis pigmentata]|uniref:ABC-2 type transport system permease protein n=1 Tax=Amycolatopsis pigmentata TaxID=450801 RepID=A0ABW5FSW5_9PSEU
MNLLAAETIKLFSVRTTWWCSVLAVLVSAAFGAVFTFIVGDEIQVTVATTQIACSFGRAVVLVSAVLAATSETKAGPVLPGMPDRGRVLAARGAVVAGWAAALGLVAGLSSWLLGTLVNPGLDLVPATAADWRALAGQPPLFALTALFGLGAGLLLRRTGVAVVAVLAWSQLVEGLLVLLPHFAGGLYRWMPFFAAARFVDSDLTALGLSPDHLPMGPAAYGAYFAAISVLIFLAGVGRNRKQGLRD